MKKKLLVVAMLLVVIMTACLLAGCNTQKMTLGFMTSADSDAEYVEINIKDYEGKMLVDLLKGEPSLGAKINDGMVSEIKNIKSGNEKYIFVFTTDESKKNTWEGANSPIVKDGVTYYEAVVGINDLPVTEDVKYMFVLIGYGQN